MTFQAAVQATASIRPGGTLFAALSEGLSGTAPWMERSAPTSAFRAAMIVPAPVPGQGVSAGLPSAATGVRLGGQDAVRRRAGGVLCVGQGDLLKKRCESAN